MNDFSFPHPLRLAVGSHEPGSGKGCAMNVISYENGDTEITDFPACSAEPLARLVQTVNDTICTHGGKDYLCPACSVKVLELGHRTVGTAVATEAQTWAWLAELLDSPEWGTIRFAATEKAVEAVRRVAAADGVVRLAFAHKAIDAWWRITGQDEVTVAPEVTAAAVEKMLAVTR